MGLSLSAAGWGEGPPLRTAGPSSGVGARPVPGVAGTHCDGGVIKEDGSAETGWGWVPTVVDGIYVQRFVSSEVGNRPIGEVCVCWLRTSSDADIDFEIVFYGDDGGQPAPAPYASFAASATGLPLGISTNFFDVPVPATSFPTRIFYVGVRWDPSVDPFFFLCADTAPATPITEVFFIDDRADDWTSVLLAADPIFSVHRAVMVRLLPVPLASLEVPVLGGWGVALLGLLLAACGVAWLRA